MSNKLHTRSVIFAALVAAWGVSGAAPAVDEAEPNNVVGSAQPLVIGGDGMAEVNGYMGDPSGKPTRDVDFYSFEGKAGDVVTVDIDGGMTSRNTGVNTVIAIFGPKGSNPFFMYRRMDRATSDDPGSVSRLDARIDNFPFDVTGKYYIGVSSAPGTFLDVNTLLTSQLGSLSLGAYKLIISGVTPSMQYINIVIKPDTTEVAPINPKSKGSIPVALLSSAEFDPMSVKPETLKFGAHGNEQSFQRCNKDGMDYNGDGRLDLVCHFDNQAANFDVGDSEGTVSGATESGKQFQGSGWLKIVGGGKR
jgi:hypothetical protein